MTEKEDLAEPLTDDTNDDIDRMPEQYADTVDDPGNDAPVTDEADDEDTADRSPWFIAGDTVIVKLVMLFFGAAAFQVINSERISTWHGWLDIWNRWDALRHTRVEETGYASSGEYLADITIFPLFPWLVRAANLVTGDTQVNAFFVSGIALAAVCILLYNLTRLDHDEPVAHRAYWFLLIFPTAFFFHINYTESVFLAVTLASFYCARTGRWRMAAAFGILSSMGRVNGLMLAPALFVEAIQQYRETRKWNWDWLAMLAMPLGFVVYLLLNLNITGDAFAFMEITREKFDKALALPWTGLHSTYLTIWASNPTDGMMVGLQELIFVIIGFAAIFLSGWLLRWSYTVWTALNWLLFVSVGFVVSVPRYVLILFPIYILFARAARSPAVYKLITTWSLLFFAIFAIQFARGYWAF